MLKQTDNPWLARRLVLIQAMLQAFFNAQLNRVSQVPAQIWGHWRQCLPSSRGLISVLLMLAFSTQSFAVTAEACHSEKFSLPSVHHHHDKHSDSTTLAAHATPHLMTHSIAYSIAHANTVPRTENPVPQDIHQFLPQHLASSHDCAPDCCKDTYIHNDLGCQCTTVPSSLAVQAQTQMISALYLIHVPTVKQAVVPHQAVQSLFRPPKTA